MSTYDRQRDIETGVGGIYEQIIEINFIQREMLKRFDNLLWIIAFLLSVILGGVGAIGIHLMW